MDGKRPTVASVHGMVAAAHPLAAEAGARILSLGGNAFDAAVATAAALNVVEPAMSGLAGQGVATCYVASEGRVRTLNFVTHIPDAFPEGAYRDREDVRKGAHTCGVPGNLAGWCELLQAYGRKSLADVFGPAIRLAREGHPLTELAVRFINNYATQLRGFSFFDDWNKTYTCGAGSVALYQILRQPNLAESLEDIAVKGPDHLYRGVLGERVVKYLGAYGGHLTMSDLDRVRPIWSEPLCMPYRGIKICTLPPPSEAFQMLVTMAILEGFDIAGMEPNGVEHLDTVWRAIRLAAGERIYNNKPSPEALRAMMSPACIDRLRSRVQRPGVIEGPTEQWLPRAPDHDKEYTTSFSVADAEGNAVCLTQSLGDGFGAGVVIEDTGICMNDFLHWAETDLRGGNPLVAGSQLAFPTAPTISLAGGKPILVLGTPGSYGILQTQPQALLQHLDFGRTLQQAVEEPRARLFDGRTVNPESRFAPDVLVELSRRGHAIEQTPAWTLLVGGMQAISLDPRTGAMIGAADPRREGYVATA